MPFSPRAATAWCHASIPACAAAPVATDPPRIAFMPRPQAPPEAPAPSRFCQHTQAPFLQPRTSPPPAAHPPAHGRPATQSPSHTHVRSSPGLIASRELAPPPHRHIAHSACTPHPASRSPAAPPVLPAMHNCDREHATTPSALPPTKAHSLHDAPHPSGRTRSIAHEPASIRPTKFLPKCLADSSS